ncbi:phosphate ABC transporter permease PstA, partial [bacterium]|nr:phosphate ABC transporter permease PstA [bacterium]
PHNIKKRLAIEMIFYGAIATLTSLALLPLALIVFDILSNGISVINWDFFTKLPVPVGESGGGISNAIIGSLILVSTASALCIPLGIGTGLFLSEFQETRFASTVRTAADILQGIPSIVIGILAYIWIVVPLGGFSALSGGMALGLMMLPAIIRTTEESLLRVPRSLIEASLALGAPYYKTVLSIALPLAMRGIGSGILLGLSRSLGETAPLLFTAFGNSFMAYNLFKPVNAMPLIIFNYAMSPYDDWQAQAWGTSLVLIVLVLGLNIITRSVISNEKIDHSD